jgi:subtilisin family serine protease
VPAIGSSGDLLFSSGTSLAAPIMSGYAALVLQQFPSLTSHGAFGLIRDTGNLNADPNNDFGYGIPFIDIVLSNIPSLERDALSLFPVPASSFIHWNSKQQFDQVQVMDVEGRMVISDSGEHSRLDVSGLTPGLYIIRFVSSRTVKQFRFVKE